MATVFAGVGAISAGALAFYNGNKTRELDTKHHAGDVHRERESALRDRFAAVSAQLANDSAAIRLGAVYSAAALADDWHNFGDDEERRVCIELLRAYLRVPPKFVTPVDEYGTEYEPSPGDQESRQTIVRLIATRAHLATDNPKAWPLDQCSLTRSQLPMVSLPEVNLTDMDLTASDLSGSQLTGAELAGATLNTADLVGADMSGIVLQEATMFGTKLNSATLIGADLSGAKMSGASCVGTNFKDTILAGASLLGANLKAANFTDADLTHAKLNRANMADAILVRAETTGAVLTDTNLDGADLSGTTLADRNGSDD